MSDLPGGARPVAHVTPPTGWLSDPNGLIRIGDRTHAFYQAYPHKADWGPMHWGHASSLDLIEWDHHPIALEPGEDGMIFSGSVVRDVDGLLGYGSDALVAYYTRHHEGHESQCIAVSTDRGLSWLRPRSEPVLEPRDGVRDFRDPVVFALDEEPRAWVMILAVGTGVEIYRSGNLIDWEFASRFDQGGSDDPILETPSLVPLRSPGGQLVWMLAVGYMVGGPESATAMKYRLGFFDGMRFTPMEGEDWSALEVGPDFYAAQQIRDASTPQWMGWLGDWQWARKGPEQSWRGALSIPRELSLRVANGRLFVAQGLPGSVRSRTQVVAAHRDLSFEATHVLPVDLGLIVVEVEVATEGWMRLEVANSQGESAEVEWNREAGSVTLVSRRWLDRERGEPMVLRHEARITADARVADLVLDVSTLECFLSGGATVTSLSFSPGSHFVSATLTTSNVQSVAVRALL